MRKKRRETNPFLQHECLDEEQRALAEGVYQLAAARRKQMIEEIKINKQETTKTERYLQ